VSRSHLPTAALLDSIWGEHYAVRRSLPSNILAIVTAIAVNVAVDLVFVSP
jgi:hypothetical protein